MKPKFEFLLAEALADGSVTGRNCGEDIPLDTVFTGLYRRDFPLRKPGEEISDPDLVFVCDVFLRLSAVEMYRRNMDSVDHGHTALLHLSGSDFATVANFVSSAQERTYYSLCAFAEPPPNVHKAE